jgi:putative Holliday junction resolvase
MPKRILCLDVGDRRIGVSISDELLITAQPLTVIKRLGDGRELEELNAILARYKIGEILVGFPKTLDDSVGPQAKKVLSFIELLKKETDLPIRLWDERLTTKASKRSIIKADLGRQRRRHVIDKVASALILQNYLDYLKMK